MIVSVLYASVPYEPADSVFCSWLRNFSPFTRLIGSLAPVLVAHCCGRRYVYDATRIATTSGFLLPTEGRASSPRETTAASRRWWISRRTWAFTRRGRRFPSTTRFLSLSADLHPICFGCCRNVDGGRRLYFSLSLVTRVSRGSP